MRRCWRCATIAKALSAKMSAHRDGGGLGTTMPLLRRRDQAGSQDAAGYPNGLLTEDRRPGSLGCHKAASDRYPLMAATCLISVFSDGQLAVASLTFGRQRQLSAVKGAQAGVSAMPGHDLDQKSDLSRSSHRRRVRHCPAPMLSYRQAQVSGHALVN